MIILTIPYKSPESILSDVPSQVVFIEYRLDYCNDISLIDWTQFHDKTILTFRDKAEGGIFNLPDKIKCILINKAILKTKALLDVEYQFLLRNTQLSIPQDRLILSLHTQLKQDKLISQFAETIVKARFYKLAVSCQRVEELNYVEAILKQYEAGKYILVPLYPCSVTARMLYKLYGSSATYVYYKTPVIRNQLKLRNALLCRINEINPDTYLYAIIGEKQVMESLSLYFYNKWFYETKKNSVFLPIVAHNAEEAISIVDWLRQRVKVKGIAVTMPFKQKITPLIKKTEQIINSWFPETERFCNTDTNAFEQAIQKFSLENSSTIIIYGKGATAQIALQVLKKKGYTNVEMLHRNDKIKTKSCKLLINCTPYGLKKTDKPEALPEFEALIDLPYGKNTTTLVKKAIANNISYIDGYVFWQMQAKFQAAFFALEPEFMNFLKPYDLAHMN